MRFYQKPIVRQYFHKGLLWRAREAQEVASYELFIDLFYVGIIAITGDTAAEHPNGESLVRFVIAFTMGWKFWSDISMLISWFDADDILRRFSVLFILTCLLGFTTNVTAAFTKTYTPLVAFYLAARLFVAVSLFWYAWKIPMVRGAMFGTGILTVLPATLWIGSIYVEEPARHGLIWPAMFLDVFGPSILIMFQRPPKFMGEKYINWAKGVFEFFPGTNIEHRIERTGQFVTLVFGSCVLGLLYQSSAEFGINAFFGKAVLGLVQAFTFNWLYFEVDSFNLHAHAIRRHVFSGTSFPHSLNAIFHHPPNIELTPPSNDMVLYPPALHNVLRAQRLRPRHPSPRPRLRRRTRRLALQNLHPALRAPPPVRLAMVLLRRAFHLAHLPHHNRRLARAQEDPAPAPAQEHAPPGPLLRCHHYPLFAACALGFFAIGCDYDGAFDVCAFP